MQTTIAEPFAVRAPDLIGRDFTAGAANQRYVGEFTYLSVGERGFLCLAAIIDLHLRRPAGWAIADHMRAPTWMVDDVGGGVATRVLAGVGLEVFGGLGGRGCVGVAVVGRGWAVG